MKKNDYRTEFEENRQKIDLNEEKVRSRAELHRKKSRKPKKTSTHRLINILLALFTFIPIGILIFVISSWYTPGEDYSAKVDESKFQVETRENKPEKEPKANDLEKEKEAEEKKMKEEAAKKEAEEAERLKKEKAEKEEAERLKKEKAEQEEAERLKKEQAKKEEAERLKQEQAKKEEEKPAARSHTVKTGETLYRISVTYYGNGDGVSKIQAANGLNSNEISVGQTLVIP